MKNNKGFSLVELIVVIAIMAILAAVAIPTFAGFITKANEAADEDYANGIQYAVELALAGEIHGEITAITVKYDKSENEITDLSYTVDNTTYNVLVAGAAPTSNAASADVRALIMGTIDADYNIKSSGTPLTFDTNKVTITVE